MKHEYLIDLLKQNKTVIVPNIGAFSNNENPHHPYLFNEYLKFNDGMMAKHISSREGITLDAAGEMIDKFTNELKEILGSGKEVVIPGLGTLVKKDGKTILNSPFAHVSPEKKNEPVTEKKAETPKAEAPKVIPPVVEKPKAEPLKVVEPKVEAPKMEVPKTVTPKVEPPKVETPKTEVPKVEAPKVEIPKVVAPKVEIPKVETPKVEPPKVEVSKIDPPKADTPRVETVKTEVPKAELKKDEPKPENKKENVPAAQKEKPKKKKRKLVWIILLFLLLGGGGTAGYLYKDDIMKMIGMGGEDKTAENKDDKEKKEDEGKKEDKEENSGETENSAPVANSADTLGTESTDETIAEEPVKTEPVKTEVPAEPIKVVAENSAPGNYYVIVGCFEMQAHADNMIAKVSAAGLTPTNVGTFGGLQHIAAGSAPDLQSAMQLATSIQGSFPKLWILKR